MISKEFLEIAGLNLEESNSLYNLQLADPIVVKEWFGLSNREIYINYDINDYLINIGLTIIQWNKDDEKANIPIEDRIPIKIFINSNGGDLSPTLNLIDIISISKTPVYNIGMGHCYSSGGLLLLSGHKRFIFKNTTFLLHDGYTGDNNSVGKAIDKIKFTEKLENNLKELVTLKTKISKSLYTKKYREDWYLFAEDMIKLGVVDYIIDDITQIL